MTRNQNNLVASAAGMAVCGAVFVASLLHQFGLLEGVSCLATFVELFILSATVVDAMEDEEATSGIRLVAVLAAVLMVVWFGVIYLRHSGS